MKLNNLKWLVPPKILLTIYNALVSSVFNYGIGVRGLASSTHISKVQSLQGRCLKAVSWKENFQNINQVFPNLKVIKVREMAYCDLIVKYKDNSKYTNPAARKTRFTRSKKFKNIMYLNVTTNMELED